MSLSAPPILFGVHNISPFSRTDKTPFGILKVIGSASIALQSSVEQLYGGAQRFSWAAESKTFGATIDCKVMAYPGFLFSQFMGATVVENAAETSGSVTALVNGKGTSVLNAATGIASIGLKSGSSADVKFSRFVVVAVSATTVDVYAYSDVDFARGTDGAFQNDSLKITATPLTIATATAVTIPNFGLELTGGSGTIAMVVGDSATSSSRPINTSSRDITVGAASTSLPAFGAVILGQKRSTGEMGEVIAYNCIGEGFAVPFEHMKFSETSAKITLIYDAVEDAVYRARFGTPTSFN